VLRPGYLRHGAAGRSHGTGAGQRDAFADLTTA